MPPVSEKIPAFRVAGIAVRTRNSDEMNPETSRIGGLWDRFFSESWEHKLPRPGADGRIFGVYSAYESNEQGAFDVLAGVAAPEDAQVVGGASTIAIEAGDYLVFHGQGSMPQMVIDAWGEVWRYFGENPQIQRRFTTDFEAYAGPDRVAIHIGI
ncbi:GyrI-like domain-containing protein [Acidovorax sp. LjRoot66]|uniref:GyrI-like domain-containing protein n=1 Tax=Acidovorax sp. LjRoot66 TaxID=3342334 RepID=UPI003ECD15D2